jgi:hypothetical protein
MPAQSKAQRRLFALALQFKRGEIAASEVSDEVKELSKLPEKALKDYASTSEEGLPDKVAEETVTLNPNMNVQGMGDVTLPGSPGALNSFSGQAKGSGDIPFNLSSDDDEELKKKKKWLLSFSEYINKDTY